MMTRRVVMGSCAMAVLGAPSTASVHGAPPANLLTPSQGAARTLGYVVDTHQADQLKYPHHSAAQSCGNCQRFRPRHDGLGTCAFFNDGVTRPGAWCSAYCPLGVPLNADRSCKW